MCSIPEIITVPWPKALKLNKDHRNANLNLAVILKELGDHENALLQAREEIKLFPENKSAYILICSLLKECDNSKLKRNQIKARHRNS